MTRHHHLPDGFDGRPQPQDAADHEPLLRLPMTQPRRHFDHDRLSFTTLVWATLEWPEIEAHLRTYTDLVAGSLVQRRRGFGLGEEHLNVLKLCDQPRTVAEIVELADLADLPGLPAFPLPYIRSLLDDLIDKGLAICSSEPDLNDVHLYKAVLSALAALPGSQAQRPSGAA